MMVEFCWEWEIVWNSICIKICCMPHQWICRAYVEWVSCFLGLSRCFFLPFLQAASLFLDYAIWREPVCTLTASSTGWWVLVLSWLPFQRATYLWPATVPFKMLFSHIPLKETYLWHPAIPPNIYLNLAWWTDALALKVHNALTKNNLPLALLLKRSYKSCSP